MAEELRPDIKCETNKVQISTMMAEALDELTTGDVSLPVIMKVVKGTAFSGNVYVAAYDETDNELLGIKELTEEDLKKLVAAALP
jgi:hypothetical protein